MSTWFFVSSFWLAALASAQSPGTFTPTGSMTAARASHTATLLLDGRVLIAGGENYTNGLRNVLASAELYDPKTGTFTATGNMTTARSWHTATLLSDGRVLIAGGSSDYYSPVATTELYDPSTGVFTANGRLVSAKNAFSATLLTNGKVLFTGGLTGPNPGVTIANPELYDPSTGLFTPAAPYATSYPTYDFGSTSTLLPDGKVLFAADPLYTPDYGAELYDAVTNTFTLTGSMVSNINNRTATLLTNGKVLLAGGEDEEARYKQAELYDPAMGAFKATGDMIEPRNGHTAIVLADGTSLITGGEGWGSINGGPCCRFLGSLASAELYDSSTGTFASTGNMTARREYHGATLLTDGRVLITGGNYSGGIDLFYGSVATAELYNPPVSKPAPALLSVSGDGKGQGAIQHAETYQLVSAGNPATAGEAIVIYCIGLIDGSVLPPQVAIGGKVVEVLWFGNTQGYPGLNQINVRVPDGVEPGPAVPVRINYIGRPSNQVTIGVR